MVWFTRWLPSVTDMLPFRLCRTTAEQAGQLDRPQTTLRITPNVNTRSTHALRHGARYRIRFELGAFLLAVTAHITTRSVWNNGGFRRSRLCDARTTRTLSSGPDRPVWDVRISLSRLSGQIRGRDHAHTVSSTFNRLHTAAAGITTQQLARRYSPSPTYTSLHGGLFWTFMPPAEPHYYLPTLSRASLPPLRPPEQT